MNHQPIGLCLALFLATFLASFTNSMIMSADHPGLTFSLRLIRSEPTYNQPEQQWSFVSDFAVSYWAYTFSFFSFGSGIVFFFFMAWLLSILGCDAHTPQLWCSTRLAHFNYGNCTLGWGSSEPRQQRFWVCTLAFGVVLGIKLES